jgi:hypothetical protein
MKKLFLTISLLLAVSAIMAQAVLTLTLANGSKGVDSISGATTTYYYANGSTGTQNGIASPHGLKASSPIQNYSIVAYSAGTAHSLVTASDSTAISWEVSFDNTNWFALTATYPTAANAVGTGGGASTLHVYTTYALLRYAQWIPTTGYTYPYIRCKMVNSTTGRKYPAAYVILKRL